jgi:hypothetical protein
MMEFKDYIYDPLYCGYVKKGIKVNGKEINTLEQLNRVKLKRVLFVPPFGFTDKKLSEILNG